MSGIRIAIAGVGNCASSLIQGLEYYKDVKIVYPTDLQYQFSPMGEEKGNYIEKIKRSIIEDLKFWAQKKKIPLKNKEEILIADFNVDDPYVDVLWERGKIWFEVTLHSHIYYELYNDSETAPDPFLVKSHQFKKGIEAVVSYARKNGIREMLNIKDFNLKKQGMYYLGIFREEA